MGVKITNTEWQLCTKIYSILKASIARLQAYSTGKSRTFLRNELDPKITEVPSVRGIYGPSPKSVQNDRIFSELRRQLTDQNLITWLVITIVSSEFTNTLKNSMQNLKLKGTMGLGSFEQTTGGTP